MKLTCSKCKITLNDSEKIRIIDGKPIHSRCLNPKTKKPTRRVRLRWVTVHPTGMPHCPGCGAYLIKKGSWYLCLRDPLSRYKISVERRRKQ